MGPSAPHSATLTPLDVLGEVVDGLPIPAVVTAKRAEVWTLLHANAAVPATFGVAEDSAGAPLTSLVPAGRTLVLEGPGVFEVLDTCVQLGEARQTRVLFDAPQGAEPRIAALLRTRWTLRMQPLSAPAGAVLITFVDLSGQLLASAERAEIAALQDLAAGLTVTKPAEQVYDDAARGAGLAAGGQRSAVLVSRGGDVFDVVGQTGERSLPPQVRVEDLASPVWQACLGRRRIVWNAAEAEEPAPLPFLAEPGWEHALLTGLRLHSRWQGIVVVGEPRLGAFDPDALERLELVATLSSTAIDNARLHDQFRSLEDLLTAAVHTSASLVEGRDAATVRRLLLDGLVDGMGLAGAALWEPEIAAGGRLMLVGSAGLPADARRYIGRLGPDTIAFKLARGALAGGLTDAVTATATSSWPGFHVRLVQVPPPVGGILGIYSDQPLPEIFDGVLATLAHALAGAVGQATLHERARTVVDALQRELRPRPVALPDGVGLGHIYRSATAGVDVGGDLVDWFVTELGFIGLACGDVSGKGVEAASLTAMAVYSLRAFALRDVSAQRVLTMLNGAVWEQTPLERFLTMAYVRIDPQTWRYEVAIAGHPPPIVLDADGARAPEVEVGQPIGIDDAVVYAQREHVLAPGQSLVLYTDGVTEARAPDGTLFGSERLFATLDAHAGSGASAQDLANRVWEAVRGWTRDGTTDDCAIVVLHRQKEASAGPST